MPKFVENKYLDAFLHLLIVPFAMISLCLQNLGKIRLYAVRIIPVYNILILTMIYFEIKLSLAGYLLVGVLLILYVHLDARMIIGQEHGAIFEKIPQVNKILADLRDIKTKLK